MKNTGKTNTSVSPVVERRCHVVAVFLAVLAAGTLPANAQQMGAPMPEIPAFLPMAYAVPQGEVAPIDGEWVITSIGKRIRIQAGRAYAVDPWLHMFVLKIQPMMVVIKDIRRTGSGEYSGQDLPLMGAWTARLGTDGTLSVSVSGALGPAHYSLMPVTQDDPKAFAQEKSGSYRPANGGDDSRRAGDDTGDEQGGDEELGNEDEW